MNVGSSLPRSGISEIDQSENQTHTSSNRKKLTLRHIFGRTVFKEVEKHLIADE